MDHKNYDRRAIFLVFALAPFAAAFSFSIRTGAFRAIKAAVPDHAAPAHSGELIDGVLGNSFPAAAVFVIFASVWLVERSTKGLAS